MTRLTPAEHDIWDALLAETEALIRRPTRKLDAWARAGAKAAGTPIPMGRLEHGNPFVDLAVWASERRFDLDLVADRYARALTLLGARTPRARADIDG